MNCDIEIDGSVGGGSVLRVAVPLALGLHKSIKISNIRANRKKPGLRNQHLIGLEALADITGSELIGGKIGSTTIQFMPADTSITKDHLSINISTAASVSLILQTLSNYAFVSGNDIELDFTGGGSHTNWSPNMDYVNHVTNPIFQIFGQEIDINLNKTGFFPKGGAKGRIKIRNHLVDSPINITNDQVSDIIISLVGSSSLQKANVLERQLNLISDKFGKDYKITNNLKYTDSLNPGTSVTVIINHSSNIPKGISKLGERGVSSEKIATQLYLQCEIEIARLSAVDEYMADQLILPLALSPIGSSITIPSVTDHVRVNLNLVHLLLGDRIKLEETSECIRLTRV
ncbi:MAG: hypothetical protein GPJ54_19790 [Candidatus Heimdallarchaeota archaeon]|nr:hypothetical protein [Candidatus Heimdallarchaeota archaeon]